MDSSDRLQPQRRRLQPELGRRPAHHGPEESAHVREPEGPQALGLSSAWSKSTKHST